MSILTQPLPWRTILQQFATLRTPLGSAVQQVSTPMAVAAGGIPTVNFNLTDITFTAGMAKRAGSVFAGAPIVQGARANAGISDALTFSRGTQISGNFYSNIDTYQGSIVFWITPEWNGNDGLYHFIYKGFSDFYIYKSNADTLRVNYSNGATQTNVSVASWVAGTTYCVVVRWDSKNKLDGTNAMCVSINDAHTFGSSLAAAITPSATQEMGTGNQYPTNAIIQGLTIYRRTLWDGTYGKDVGNGDEINQIWAAGVGKDPCLVTGSWDVVFCLPTNSTVGALVSGIGEAWSHPHDNTSQKLTDWCCATTYASSGWSTAGTPSAGPADIAAAANKVYNWGYQFTAAADLDGIKQTKAGQTAGADFVLRCVAHSSDANPITVQVYDETNAAIIKDFDFGGGSTVTAPGVALFSFELPTIARGAVANCVSFTTKILGTAAGQTVFVHQCELL